jgi:glycolate oxidase FAD binding subunit
MSSPDPHREGLAHPLAGPAVVRVESVAEIEAAVRGHRRIAIRGGGTKPGLWRRPSADVLLDLSGLSGVVAYDPGEFTFTAGAGTRLSEVLGLLSERGQYLPFDPPLVSAGSTLGGAAAAGLAGSGRARYGGVRDFLIGIRFVDGRGAEVRGGGQVVKNAAGFDFPKLMVGSLGRLGVLTELTFKVFPAPPGSATLRAEFGGVGDALEALVSLCGSRFDLDGIDLVPYESGAMLDLRAAGPLPVLARKLDRIGEWLRRARGVRTIATVPSEAAAAQREEMRELTFFRTGDARIRVPVTPARIARIDGELERAGAVRRYVAAGAAAWISWPGDIDGLDRLLRAHGLGAVRLDGPGGRPWLGTVPGRAFLARLASSLDPEARFGALEDFPG